MMAVLEEDVLKPTPRPKNSASINSDDWPTFSLSKGSVVSQKNGEPVSLLSAHKSHPVKVTGNLLRVPDEARHLVRDPNYTKRPIELSNVTSYAFAEYTDGTYGFWAAGKAGWFEFDSFAPAYRSIHDQMNEATSLLYTLADRLRQAKRAPASSMEGANLKKYMQRVFTYYISCVANPAKFMDIEDVEDAFREHRRFLITCMLEGQENLDWLNSPLFAYCEKNFPADVASLTALILPATTVPISKRSTATFDAMPPAKKRRSESPHVEEPQPKKKKNGHLPRRTISPTLLPKTPPPKLWQEADISEDEEDSLAAIPHKRKSILRPSGGQSAKRTKTATAARRTLSSADEDSSSEDELHRDAAEVPITTITDGRHLNQITNPAKQQQQSGRHTTFQDHQEDYSPPQYLPRKYLELSLAEYDIPSVEPQGPGGLWTCTFDGCHVRVHQAASVSGQERVRDHLKSHIANAKDKIDLVLDESRPYLPVNNLVRRLQAFAPPSDQDLPPESIERTFSAPIRRKF